MPESKAYKSIAVIGSGPSGLSAVKALSEEKKFDVIKAFERRDRIGGTWLYDPEPDIFPVPNAAPKQINLSPPNLPSFANPAPEDTTQRTGLYDYLDSNVGASAMEFTYASIPKVNSALSVRRYGFANPTRPYKVVADYLETIFAPFLHLVTFNTTLERLSKNERTGKWELVLRKTGIQSNGKPKDFWWREEYDAVVVATGHYSVPHIPKIPGLEDWYRKFPEKLEHSKQFRNRDDYVDKTVVVVGGSVSASDYVLDLHTVVRGSLITSQRGLNANPALENVWKLPNVIKKPTISRLAVEDGDKGGRVEFSDGSWVTGVDKLVFATGYKLSYPFIQPNPVTPHNRLAGFYQHVFKTGDPSLSVIGQVRAALSFKVYEYQAVAVARVLSGRGALPSIEEQNEWEEKRLAVRGPTHQFHTLVPDFKEYFEGMRAIAAKNGDEDVRELPEWKDEWADLGFRVLELKDSYVRKVARREALLEREERVLAKL